MNENEARVKERELIRLNKRIHEEQAYVRYLEKQMYQAKGKIESLQMDIKLVEELLNERLH